MEYLFLSTLLSKKSNSNCGRILFNKKSYIINIRFNSFKKNIYFVRIIFKWLLSYFTNKLLIFIYIKELIFIYLILGM